MSAPKGNQFWKKRSKHGRDKIFATPELMLEAAYEYFDFQEKRIWEKTEYKGKDVEMVKIPTAAPFTMTGLCIFLGVNTQYFGDFKKTATKDFSLVIKHIEEVVYNQKFEGAAVGAYSSNIIARDLGLNDVKKVEVTDVVKNKELNDYEKLDDPEDRRKWMELKHKIGMKGEKER